MRAGVIVAGRRGPHRLRAALARPHADRHDRQRLRGRARARAALDWRTSSTCSTPSTASSARALSPSDLTGAYAGVRPLISTADPKKSVDISRRAELYETSSGLVTITGGKLTTWRRMAKMAVDRIVEREGREAPCRTHEIPLGPARSTRQTCPSVDIRRRGEPRPPCRTLRARGRSSCCAWSRRRRSWAERISPELPDILAEAPFAAAHEQARSLGDVLLRRTRLGLLDARHAHRARSAERPSGSVAEAMARRARLGRRPHRARARRLARAGASRGARGARAGSDRGGGVILRLRERALDLGRARADGRS